VPGYRRVLGCRPAVLIAVLTGLAWLLAGQLSVRHADAAEGKRYPIRRSWDFETTDNDGNEIFSQERVPILIDTKYTQPDWLQIFGVEASPIEPDRYPRSTLAHFTSKRRIEGDRSLHLRTRGDHQILRSRFRKKIFGHAEILLKGRVWSEGLKLGEVRVAIRFFESGFEIPGSLLESGGHRGKAGWREEILLLRGRAPVNAQEFEIEIKHAHAI
jgi:hypothetical protein